jgi:hypothetical protein
MVLMYDESAISKVDAVSRPAQLDGGNAKNHGVCDGVNRRCSGHLPADAHGKEATCV